MNTRKVLTVAMGALMLLCLGLIYGWSIFVAPLEKEFGWIRSQTSLTFTISMAMFCIGSLVGGALTVRKVKRLFLLISSGLLLLAGFYAASFSQQLIHFYVFYGVFCGFGVGLSYNVIISSVTKLFPGKQGLVSGILMMGFGFGGLVLGSFCSSLLATMGWRSTFQVIGILIGAIIIVGGFLIDVLGKETGSRVDSAKASKPETNKQEGNPAAGMQKSSQASPPEYQTRDMMRNPTFQFLFVWLVLLSSAGLMIIGHIAPCVLELGGTPATAALAVGIVSVFNGVGRVSFGFSYDKLGIQKTLWLINSFLLLAGILLSASVATANMTLLFIGCAVTGMSYGGSPVSTSAIVHKLFGNTFFSSNFSIAVSNLIFAALIGPTLAGYLQSSSGSYQTSFYALVVIGVIALILCWILTTRVTRFITAAKH